MGFGIQMAEPKTVERVTYALKAVHREQFMPSPSCLGTIASAIALVSSIFDVSAHLIRINGLYYDQLTHQPHTPLPEDLPAHVSLLDRLQYVSILFGRLRL